MEIKCPICGTMNDGETNFCKGCFQKLTESDKKILEVAKVEDSVEVQMIEEEEIPDPWEEVEPIGLGSEIEQVVPLEWKDDGFSDVEPELNMLEESQEEVDSWETEEDRPVIENQTNNESSNLINAKEEIMKTDKKPIFSNFLKVYIVSLVVSFIGLYILNNVLPNVINEDDLKLLNLILYPSLTLVSIIVSITTVLKKYVIEEQTISKTIFSILGIIIVPTLLIELFLLGFVLTDSVFLFVIGIIFAIMMMNIFLNYVLFLLKKMTAVDQYSKKIFPFGIISIVIIIALVVIGTYASENKLTMPSIPFINQSTKIQTDMVYLFIDQSEKTILKNEIEDINYVVPNPLTNVHYAEIDGVMPEEMELITNESGGVISGKIVYQKVTYYFDGEKIKAE